VGREEEGSVMEESLERSDQAYDAAPTPIRLEPGEFKKIGEAYGLSHYMIEVVTSGGHEIRITARRNPKSGELVGGPALPYSARYEERVEIWVGDRRAAGVDRRLSWSETRSWALFRAEEVP
jgi:hypothetical protein